MNLESVPYLQEILPLYERIRKLEALALAHEYRLEEEGPARYLREDIDTVIDACGAAFALSPELLDPFREAMKTGLIDFLSLARGETPAFAAPLAEDDLSSLLFLVSRPFFRSVRTNMNLDGVFWEDGRCPLCGAVPSLSVIEPGQKRRYSCSFCRTAGHASRIGCPNCANKDPETFDIVSFEGEQGIRADACRACGSYVKTADASLAEAHSMDEIDLMTIPVDLRLQEEGYRRRSPNPVGAVSIR